ncbi:hypothetical protein GCM10023215_31700 [Pseudonocardia yuanmonensis]|uniref:Flavin reductase like domain-containing protein n=1 Tax=Pseudonocardia yuanmonensis TaxID=1095914 RepID=A0ABP8WMD1_9PSEU
MGTLPAGLVALAGLPDPAAGPHGLVVGTFQSLSLAPALVTFSVARTSTSRPGVRRAGRLCASVLAEGQEHVRRALSRRQPDK